MGTGQHWEWLKNHKYHWYIWVQASLIGSRFLFKPRMVWANHWLLFFNIRGSAKASLKNLSQVQVQNQNLIHSQITSGQILGSLGFLGAFIFIFSRFFVCWSKVSKSWIFIGGRFRGDFWAPWVILSRLSHSRNFISFWSFFSRFVSCARQKWAKVEFSSGVDSEVIFELPGSFWVVWAIVEISFRFGHFYRDLSRVLVKKWAKVEFSSEVKSEVIFELPASFRVIWDQVKKFDFFRRKWSDFEPSVPQKNSFTKSCLELKMVSRNDFCTSFEPAQIRQNWNRWSYWLREATKKITFSCPAIFVL